MFCLIEDSSTAMLCLVCYKNFTSFTSWQLFPQSPAANHSHIHLHFPFHIADSHARTPQTLILQAFTIGFEVSVFVGWLCEKRRVSVLRCFCTALLFGVLVSLRWGIKVQVNTILHVLPHASSFCTGRKGIRQVSSEFCRTVLPAQACKVNGTIHDGSMSPYPLMCVFSRMQFKCRYTRIFD